MIGEVGRGEKKDKKHRKSCRRDMENGRESGGRREKNVDKEVLSRV